MANSFAMEGGAPRPASRLKGSQLHQLAGSPSYFFGIFIFTGGKQSK